MLEIKDLKAGAEGRDILKGVTLAVKPGEVHAIMGPNGSGKSTLARVLAGHPAYEVTGGAVEFNGKDLLDLDPEERACEGVFMAFQYPVEIPGVNNSYFLKAALNAQKKYRGEPELDAMDFLALVKDRLQVLHIDDDLMRRPVNEGFSGGEKKRNEIFQMLVLQPSLAILDETDSGLDIDALNTVAQGVNTVAEGTDMGVLIITHYQRILHLVEPARVSIMFDGRIVKEGGPELVEQLEREGYGPIIEEVEAGAAA